VTAIGLCYVGDPSQALDAAQFLERHTDRDVRVVAAPADDLDPALEDDRVDALLLGGTLDAATLQQAIDAVDATGAEVPVFDLSDEIAAVPERVDHYHLYPGTDPIEAADRVLSVVDTPEDGAGATTDRAGTATTDASGAWTRPVFQGMDAYVAVDTQRRVTAWDPKLGEQVGVELADAVGRPLTEIFPPADETPFRAACDRVRETGDPETTEFQTSAGDWLRVRVTPDGRDGLRCFVRDVSDREAYKAEIEATRERFENTIERITDAFFVLDTDERFVILNSRAESLLDVDADEVVGERFWDVFPAAVSTSFYHGFNEAMDTQQPTSFEEHYQPQDSWFEVNAYPSEDGLSVFLRDITDRVTLQHKLESLHEQTQQLIVSETDVGIAETAVDAAVDVLGLPLTICWRYDGTRRQLEPLAHSRAVDERVTDIQPIDSASALAWQAFEADEQRVVDSVALTTPTSHHPGDVGSELLVPLGEYGLLGTYADEENAFDETDVELFRILGATVESAMARAERERQLARRNDRLDDFASIVSHDLRNPLHVASARTQLALDSGDVDHLETVVDALDRMETLIEDLLARARGNQEIDRRPLSLETAAQDAWEGVDTRAATLAIENDATFEADATRLKQLFENLVRNAVEHGSEDVTVRIGTHTDGFYVADDGPGVPDEIREDIFEQGVTGSDDGTGYGLAIVADIVRGHDWSISVSESRDGGARFDVCHVHSLTERQPH